MANKTKNKNKCKRCVPNGSKTLDLRSERFIDLMCAKLTDHVLD